VLKANNINKSYGKLQILKDVSLEIEKGEVVSIVGSSGAGKSTLLHILGTLGTADSGHYSIKDQSIFDLNEKQLDNFRNKEIGFIFQFHHLLPEFSALENVCIPAFINGTSQKDAEIRAKELISFLGLKDRINHKPSELSGGEQQRIAVARALMNEPSIIMADEPSGNLDSKTSKELHKLFFDLRKEFNQTFIIVTHNNELAEMSDRQLVMKDGRIVS
jgi:lipoprotein-releasing system ATP-binding protein